MADISKSEAKKILEEFFTKDRLNANQIKKMKKLAMKHRIRLKEERKKFCKECYSDLKNGKVRISGQYKQVKCPSCNSLNKYKLKN